MASFSSEGAHEEQQLSGFPLSGRVANVLWRAIPMEDLRAHPLYQDLPSPNNVVVLSAKDFGRFQQDSFQWNALHEGRLTTSLAASVLGFFESFAGGILQVPRSLLSHDRVMKAWQHLKRKSSISIDEFHHAFPSAIAPEEEFPVAWISSDSNNSRFPMCYAPPYSDSDSQFGLSSCSEVRLAWGSAQEATALLAIVNYFAINDPSIQVCESGMLCFEAIEDVVCCPSDVFERRSENLYFETFCRVYIEKTLPLLGASPDGLLRYKDGTIEVVEVKCFSPFVSSRSNSMELSLRRPRGGVAVWHLPQLQMEMFCAGPNCTGAVFGMLFVDGMVLYRVQRDNEYIAEMLDWIQTYYHSYHTGPTNKLKSPPPNFFQSLGGSAYRQFLSKTLRLAGNAELLASLSDEDIQRSPMNLNLFLS